MQNNHFQDLNFFHENEVNKFCDLLTQEVFKITGKTPHLVGSVARMLNGTLPEYYIPKDVDFAIDNISFRKILNYHQNGTDLFRFAKMIETRPERFILYCDGILIEIWNFLERNKSEKIEYKHNKISYLCQ